MANLLKHHESIKQKADHVHDQVTVPMTKLKESLQHIIDLADTANGTNVAGVEVKRELLDRMNKVLEQCEDLDKTYIEDMESIEELERVGSDEDSIDEREEEKVLANAFQELLANGQWSAGPLLESLGKAIEKIFDEYQIIIGVKERPAEDLSMMGDAAEENNQDEAASEKIVYISVFNMKGDDLDAWAEAFVKIERMGLSARRVYDNEESIRNFVGERPGNKDGYLKVKIASKQILDKASEQDEYGLNLSVRDGSINKSNIISFTYGNVVYELIDDKLVATGERQF